MNSDQYQVILELLLEIRESGMSNPYKIWLYLVPHTGIIFGTTLLYFLFHWWHKQKMALISTGQYKPWSFDLRLYSFLLGLLLTFTGIALSIVFIIVLGKSMAILGGLIPFAIGLGLLTFYKLSH